MDLHLAFECQSLFGPRYVVLPVTPLPPFTIYGLKPIYVRRHHVTTYSALSSIGVEHAYASLTDNDRAEIPKH